ncbi:daf-12-interacting protein 1-like [Mercenaria mercenaria]|uniref:daf-12-interacting protein 1-like n=1 Tax=Mercenaria mercenaria TaxID=6596 RepID=UPI00234ECA0C|nr:daf-12-interacting protein 1-like [Mercenaria mercenaria]
MDRHFDRSHTRAREKFPPIPPGRTSLSSSTETVAPERPLSSIQRKQSIRQTPFPPLTENTKRQRPNSGRTSTSPNEEIKRQRPGSGQKLTAVHEVKPRSEQSCVSAELKEKATKSCSKMELLQKQTNRNIEKLKSFSVQQLGNEFTPSPNLSSCFSESAANRPPTPLVVDVKAERKRKRREKKEREAKKMEEARKKEQDKLEAERMMAELSRNRSMFNRNKSTLPAIGRKTAEANFHIGKLPRIQEHEITGPSLPDNNVVDVIKKHEAQVRITAFLREISQDYMNASAELIEPYTSNGAIDVIEKHEEEVGRTYAMYTGNYPTGSSYSTNSVCQPASARSRCSSGVSRRGAA